jgi:hypothetical protein
MIMTQDQQHDDEEIPDYMKCAAHRIMTQLHELSEGRVSGDPWKEMTGVFEAVWEVMAVEDVFTTQLFANTSPDARRTTGD